MSTDSYNTVSINRAALQHNFRVLQGLAGPGVRQLPMIKSEAYGHGLVAAAQAFSAVGADAFGVAELEEGIRLREAGIQGDILIFLGTSNFKDLLAYELTPVVFDRALIQALSAFAVGKNRVVGVHLKIDTGMGRFGILPEETASLIQEIVGLPGVFLAGVLSHFPKADEPLSPLTKEQNAVFEQLCRMIPAQGSGGQQALCHLANSAGLIHFPETRHDMVRPGISLYGCHPSGGTQARDLVGLQPAMSFMTQIVQMKSVPAGYGVSYGHLFTTSRPSHLAVLPVGYADGYLRCLTGKASVLIGGRRAPLCGRVCMNATVVDVTDIPEAQVGDEVVLLGRQTKGDFSDEISADEVAGWMGTISYEVLCLFGNSNHRTYL